MLVTHHSSRDAFPVTRSSSALAPATASAALVHHHLGRPRPRVVVRAHHEAVGAGAPDGNQLSWLHRPGRDPAPGSRPSRTPAPRVGHRRPARSLPTGQSRGTPCNGWSQQVVHPRVDDHEILPAGMLPVQHTRQQHARLRDEVPPRLHYSISPAASRAARRRRESPARSASPRDSDAQPATDVELRTWWSRGAHAIHQLHQPSCASAKAANRRSGCRCAWRARPARAPGASGSSRPPAHWSIGTPNFVPSSPVAM